MASVKIYLGGGLVCFAAAVFLAWQIMCSSSFCGRSSLVDPSRFDYDRLVSTDSQVVSSAAEQSSSSSSSVTLHESGSDSLISDRGISNADPGVVKSGEASVPSSTSEVAGDENAVQTQMEPNDKATDSNSNTGAEFVSSNAGNSAAQERINSNGVEEAKELDRNGNGVELQLANETKTIAEQIAEENSCEGKRMYMYELPSEFNSKILEKCSRGMVEWLDFCPHIANQGFGQALPAADWYATDAYMLEIIYHTRMKNYNCLTSDPTAADAFFLPYYSGLDALRFIYGADKARKHEHGTELIQWLDQNAPETWKRWGGSDHFVVMGRTAWDFANSVDNTQGWGTSFLELPAMANVTALVLERRSWRDREQAVPYPTGFHPSSPSKLREWISTVESSPRSFLFSFIGALRPRIAANIRGALFTQCQQHPSCLLLDCAQLGCSHNPQPISEALLNSTFCLQPVGDSFTRRSTFDSIAAGCIPVFFHNESAYTQYMWHLPKDASLYSVFIPEDAIRGGAMVADVLGSYSAEKIKEMQGHVKDLIDGVLYTDAAAGGVRDAFEVSVEGMLAMAAQGRAHRQQVTVYQSQNWKD